MLHDLVNKIVQVIRVAAYKAVCGYSIRYGYKSDVSQLNIDLKILRAACLCFIIIGRFDNTF